MGCEEFSVLNFILGHVVEQIAQMQADPLVLAESETSKLLLNFLIKILVPCCKMKCNKIDIFI